MVKSNVYTVSRKIMEFVRGAELGSHPSTCLPALAVSYYIIELISFSDYINIIVIFLSYSVV